jgi:hypothetical protein
VAAGRIVVEMLELRVFFVVLRGPPTVRHAAKNFSNV